MPPTFSTDRTIGGQSGDNRCQPPSGHDNRAIPGGTASHKVEQIFDTGGRVTGELHAFGRAIFPTSNRTFGLSRTFDPVGNRLTTTGYDGGQLNPQTNQVTGTVDYHDVMTHDAQNRMASITRRVGPGATALAENPPGAMHVLLGYDAADRPTRTIRYAGAGPFSTPVTMLSTHDGAGRIAAIDHAFGGNTISRYTSTFDDAGQLAERSAKLTSSAVDAALRDFDGLVDRFDHDARGQVISRDADAGVPDERFATDAAGNRTGRSTSITGVPAETHAIGEDNRLDGDGVYTYTHDAEGNRTGKVGGGESWTYTWDHRNRLSSASEAGGRSISYVYDGMDRLIGRVSRLGNQITDREAYGHDGAQVTLVLPEFGSALVRYLWGPGTDQLIGMQEVAAPGGQANAISWTLTDHLGSVRDRVDEAGVLLGHADYTAFGEVIDQTAMGSVSVGEAMAYGFTGRPIDVTTGLQNNRARWYDAVSSIWVSQDPIGFAAGDANLYRYVGNSPTTYTDPTGLEEASIGPPSGAEPPFVSEPWYRDYDRLRQLKLAYERRGEELPFSEGSQLAAMESRVQQGLFIHKATCNGYGPAQIAAMLIFRPGGGFDEMISLLGSVRATPITRAGGATTMPSRPTAVKIRPTTTQPAPGQQRPLTPADLGLPPGRIQVLGGTIGRRGNNITVQVHNINVKLDSRGTVGTPFSVMEQLAVNAKHCGASNLTITGLQVGNTALAKILVKRYGFEFTPQRTLQVTIPLNQSP